MQVPSPSFPKCQRKQRTGLAPRQRKRMQSHQMASWVCAVDVAMRPAVVETVSVEGVGAAPNEAEEGFEAVAEGPLLQDLAQLQAQSRRPSHLPGTCLPFLKRLRRRPRRMDKQQTQSLLLLPRL